MKTYLNKSNALINKQLMTVALLFFISFFLFPFTKSFAQDILHPEFEGTWVLDSVQVKEVLPNSAVQKTVLSGESSNFSGTWMLQFTLKAEGKADYKEINKEITNVAYLVKDINGNKATLNIDGVPDYKVLDAELLSGNALLITHSFIAGYNLQDIEVSWKMFYHKSKQ
jgi:hypothetical protein